VGPRGGKVRKHLKDPRFHEGFRVTIVAEGNTAEEVHLGFAKDVDGDKTEPTKTAKQGTRTEGQSPPTVRPREAKGQPTRPADATATAKNIARQKEATKLEAEDDEEIPGHVKSFDASRRILVLTLLNGKSKSFILAQDVPVHIKGAAAASR